MIKKILFYIFFIIIIVISGLIWPYISLPYENTSIISEYSKNNYNQNNDLIRYLVFILIPILSLILLLIISKKFSIRNIVNNISIDYEEKKSIDLSILGALLIFIIFLILEFLSVNFPMHLVDSFHEGQKMSSAFKYISDKSLWSGSYVTVGIIYETLASYFIWEIFDNISIGSIRFFRLFLIFILKILLVALSYQIAKSTNLKGFFKNIYFILISFISIGLINYLFEGGHLVYREIPVLITLIIFFQFILGGSKSRYLILLFGPISCFSIFYSLDRGIVCNLFIIVFLIYLLINKEIKFFLICVLSIIFSWLISFFYLGNEFGFFIENTISTIKEINQIGGLIHPIPFSSDQNAARAFKNLFFISFGLIISINLMNKKNENLPKNFIFILLLISILCFLTYGYAIGRSDGPHIKSTFGYSIIFYCSLLIYFLLNFLNQKINLFRSIKTIFLSAISFMIIIVIFFQSLNFHNIYNFKSRLYNYVNLDDDKFLTFKDNNFIKNAEKILIDYDCIQIFSNDVLMLYLLRKPNCTKFYFPITIGSEKNQKYLIDKLKKVKIVLADKDTNEFSPNKRLPLLQEYINQNYNKLYDEDNWIIFKSKN